MTTSRHAPIRYMGTKRHLVPHVLQVVHGLRKPPTRFVDLFAGTGSVAASMEDRMSVTCSDALRFPAQLAKPRFLRRRGPAAAAASSISLARELIRPRLSARGQDLAAEQAALKSGYEQTGRLIQEARHAGNDAGKGAAARKAARAGSYSMATLYFARGYFSTYQAICLDALRQAIDELHPPMTEVVTDRSSERDTLLAAWLITASRIMNSPGHTAQFLRANNPISHQRVDAAWRRCPLAEFSRAVELVRPLGRSHWRRGNSVLCQDATTVESGTSKTWGSAVLYADPPYTKDHYSRYYHVLETLLAYDYPTSRGAGRLRDDRHQSDFCYRTRASAGFAKLGELSASSGAPLLVSYPSAGLIGADELIAALEPFGRVALAAQAAHRHSTLGGTPGHASQDVTECIYLLTPR